MNSYQQSPNTGRVDVVLAVRIDPETRNTTLLSDDEIAVASAAANAVFSAAGVTASLAARADWEVEGWDIAGFPEPGPVEWFDLSDAWGEAREAAVTALAARWPDFDTTWIELQLDDPEEPA